MKSESESYLTIRFVEKHLNMNKIKYSYFFNGLFRRIKSLKGGNKIMKQHSSKLKKNCLVRSAIGGFFKSFSQKQIAVIVIKIPFSKHQVGKS